MTTNDARASKDVQRATLPVRGCEFNRSLFHQMRRLTKRFEKTKLEK